MKTHHSTPVIAALALSTVLAACDAVDETDAVARAGDQILTVDAATALLVDQEHLPAEAGVVETLGELWIDYTLLATHTARDSTFGFLELSPLVRQQMEQEMIFQLRDSMLQVDTVVTDEQLRGSFDADAPGTQIRARHILLAFPQGATQAGRDSVRTRLEALRERAVSGESFAGLARTYSEDPGSAARGGDLGFFGRGDMVRPIEEAVFALEPGEISPVVESPYGFHLIQLQERRSADFEEVRVQLRNRLLDDRYLSAESTFVAGVEADADAEFTDDAVALAREIARHPGRTLTARAGRRELATYRGGAYTAAEFQAFVQGREASFREQIGDARDEQIENFLRGMVRRELLVEAARDAGMDAEPQVVDSLVGLARDRLRGIARRIGVLPLERAPGEAIEPAVQRAVREALSDVLSGASDVVPLGQISFQLRRGEPTRVYTTGVGEVVLRIARTRAGRTPSPAEGGPASDSLASPLRQPGN